MKNPNDGFIRGRIRSFKFAFQGAWLLLTTEHSIMVQSSLGVIMIIAGFYFNISPVEWMIQILAISVVLATEALNTGIERVADFIHPDYHKKIGIIKDVAAGAVTFVALGALIIGLIIYVPKILNLI
ncbi:diacylglycerol kinase family protein [Aureivirga sp. CE67]|uniref:diacylglycerol kinase family protein n=1 Tax=Aureivirga sp. CE67 TaxID=1788983 RepID=UPI0018CAC90A|nr:diacylglycerol kinase family protein [Aureivirga sp. CE67]